MGRTKSLITKEVKTKKQLAREQKSERAKMIRAAEERIAAAMTEPDALSIIESTGSAEHSVGKLSADQRAQLDYHETEIESGIKKYLSLGKHFYGVHLDNLFIEYGSWANYCKTRWKMSASGVLDLIASYRTWKILKTKPLSEIAPVEMRALSAAAANGVESAPLSGEPVLDVKTDADAPSQNAVDTLREGINKFLVQGDLSPQEFGALQEQVTRLVYELATESAGGKATGISIARTLERIVDFLQTDAVEIDGEQIRTSGAGSIIITQDVYEAMVQQKTAIREWLIDRDERLNSPQTRTVKVSEKAKIERLIAEPTVDCYQCGEMGTIYNILHGGVQLSCGCIYTMPPNSNALVYDELRTKNNPLKGDE